MAPKYILHKHSPQPWLWMEAPKLHELLSLSLMRYTGDEKQNIDGKRREIKLKKRETVYGSYKNNMHFNVFFIK